MKIRFECAEPDELREAAEILAHYFRETRIFCFYGEMGAGKTTFIKAICKELGALDKATSPTFSLVNEYQLRNQKLAYHFDLYRVANTDELEAIGFKEYLDSGNYCLIEWPALAQPFLNSPFVYVEIIVKEEVRIISMELRS